MTDLSTGVPDQSEEEALPQFETLDEVRNKAAAEHIRKVYRATRSMTKTAEIIGRNRPELYRLLKRLGIDLKQLREK